MDKQTLDFWQEHSLHFLEMVLRNDKRQCLRHPDGYGTKAGACGDLVEIFLAVADERIEAATFETNGCINTIACANTVVTLLEGRTATEAWEITAEQVIEYLETLPIPEHHCAEMAVVALRLALASLGETKKAPWKKFYREGRC